MKRKLLINSNKPALIKDFFLYSAADFECMSTSDVWEDITAHFTYFKPEGYIFCPDCFSAEDMSRLNNIRKLPNFNASLFMLAEPEICDTFEERAGDLVDLFIKRPITIANLEKSLANFYINKDRSTQLAIAQEEAKKAEEERLAAEALKGTKRHVLVIDDDRSVLKLLKTILEEKYEVTTMVSGRMAQKFLETRYTDIILLDYEMPVENGPEVFKRLKEDKKTSNIPVVFLTGVAESSKIKQVLALKPQGYLLKPIETGRLISTIEEVIG